MFFAFFFLFLGAEETLWSGKTVNLVHQEGLLTIAMNREASLENLLDEEKLEFEATIGKMQAVFEEVFGFGDFTRWMPLHDKKLSAYLIPVGAYAALDEVNVELKVQTMLFAFKSHFFPPLSQEQVVKVQTAARRILEQDPQPIVLKDSDFLYTKAHEAFLLLQEHLEETQEWRGPWKKRLSFSTICHSFCNPEILAKQEVFSSPLHSVLYKTRPYTKHQLLIVPRRHITTISENSSEEILEKWKLFAHIQSVALRVFDYPKLGVMTRIGWRAGQTQAHLHDHVVPYDPLAKQSWMTNWAHELSQGTELIDDATQWEKNQLTWQTYFLLENLQMQVR